MIGAREAGVDAFLVPAGENATDARKYAHGLRIIPVHNFQQALQALATLPAKPTRSGFRGRPKVAGKCVVFRADKPLICGRAGVDRALGTAFSAPRQRTTWNPQGPTVQDCYFRRQGLCALAPERPCPTFRARGHMLEPPRQPRLMPRRAAVPAPPA